MTDFVVDASVAIKWVVEEAGTPQAIALRRSAKLIAPDLIVAECANVLWKKTQRGELTPREADLAARLLERVDIELAPTRGLLAAATRIALAIAHPAYDCIYVALALARQTRYVTADQRLVDKLARLPDLDLREVAVSLDDAAKSF